MLSYRHIFHAGNFADVLKHSVLIHSLGYLKKKDKPFCYIDTHSGPGKYRLDNEQALKNREFDTGIGALWGKTDLPMIIGQYIDLIKEINGSDNLTAYPGSPLIAKRLLREQDRLFFYELHSTEIAALTARFKRAKTVKVFQADGLKASLAQLPPSQHRGLIMIDPSYEIRQDYKHVVEALVNMTKRFATGIYALWYPVVERSRCDQLERAIIATGIKNVQLFELGVHADNSGYGMTASGMIVINPPWTLADQMQLALPYLARVLGDNNNGHYRIKTLSIE